MNETFEQYLNEVITHNGQTGKRKHVHSLEWRPIAEQVWNDCMERQNANRARKRTTRSREKVPG